MEIAPWSVHAGSDYRLTVRRTAMALHLLRHLPQSAVRNGLQLCTLCTTTSRVRALLLKVNRFNRSKFHVDAGLSSGRRQLQRVLCGCCGVRYVVHDDRRLASPSAKQYAQFAARMLHQPDFWVRVLPVLCWKSAAEYWRLPVMPAGTAMFPKPLAKLHVKLRWLDSLAPGKPNLVPRGTCRRRRWHACRRWRWRSACTTTTAGRGCSARQPPPSSTPESLMCVALKS